jgi:hypothetical protein
VDAFFSALDDGDSLKQLLLMEQALFKNNYPQVILAHAASSMACNLTVVQFLSSEVHLCRERQVL